ncbi:MAG TPA: hypothetical protein DEF41_14155 [Desulfovibrio sp.]|uniref:Uncharacterized protein n=1 Tax=Nitratidesulfovibrio vulgaris (strain ATCC 29579 / DSM 644 / CCUG 34227 / NCIMB 8303 / VKM B-1760 / Hildenborough) TaxID=882 RepID=Q72CQ4_NITV2|nr:hypothetical protein DVU_1229 [Nitratidesulfovibrio vulgaris str. Hildenborough]HBW17229.1 hypothetical protein [Desulfovibrio sp.]
MHFCRFIKFKKNKIVNWHVFKTTTKIAPTGSQGTKAVLSAFILDNPHPSEKHT